jgi:ketosteroid isomerase-like protein
MHPNEELLAGFYGAFSARDHQTMALAYSDDATFSDPVFPQLDAEQVRAMWKMFCSGGNVDVTFKEVQADDLRGSATWEARYEFPTTGRPVHNVIHAAFDFEDGRIVRHVDSFDFYRWSRMALGAPGVLLGWSPIVKNKVRAQAAARLSHFMDSSTT